MKNNFNNMMCLDLFLSHQTDEAYKTSKKLLKPSVRVKSPLKSLDFYIDHFSAEMNKLDRENDIIAIKEFSDKYSWRNSLDSIFKNEDFEAIVLTNLKQEIIWVNDGFKKMTGYTKSYAKDKTPSFLQGTNTCEKTRKRIRKKLTIDEPFTDIVLNYRKDKTPFRCEIKIFPLYTETTTHYIALERAV